MQSYSVRSRVNALIVLVALMVGMAIAGCRMHSPTVEILAGLDGPERHHGHQADHKDRRQPDQQVGVTPPVVACRWPRIMGDTAKRSQKARPRRGNLPVTYKAATDSVAAAITRDTESTESMPV